MTWTIRTDCDFDRAMKKLDRQIGRRVLKALIALENLDNPTQRCKRRYRALTQVCGDCGSATTASSLTSGERN